jgi:FKBP-type peptidyl-prolyl cis-trans isomerase 2
MYWTSAANSRIEQVGTSFSKQENSMSQAKQGDRIKLHYTGRLANGTVFDSSENRQPLELQLGEQKLLPGFEQALLGMSVGEKKTIELQPDEAYGPRREELVATVERTQLPPHSDPQPGQMVKLQQQDGQEISANITKVTDSSVTFDANHPLAGHALTFDIHMLEVA